MADIQLREKMKKISEAAKHGEQVPERSKKVGLILFLILIGCGVVVLLGLAIGLLLSKHVTSAIVISIIAVLLVYSIVKVMKADDIGQL